MEASKEGVMTGLLRIRGKIDLRQFWPEGESDADTTKIKVIVGANSFAHAADGKTFKTTHAFDTAFAKGTSRKKLIDAQGRVTVRLQGIDAPELHFQAGALKADAPGVTPEKRAAYNAANRRKRRQYQAETATVALGQKLSQFGAGMIDCEMLSLVDHPYEVVDTYGRFIGNIKVGKAFATDINIWLAEQGWAYPTFYSSMESEEIDAFLAAMKVAGRKNVWRYYATDTKVFDPNLVERKPPTVAEPSKDKGPVLMPKLFRRQVAHRMETQADIFNGAFKAFLEKRPDTCYDLKDFLANGVHSAKPRRLDQFMDGARFTVKPHEIVFGEKPSTVVDENGKIVKNF
jgi:endonuclease YncB( thermonuclease family)